MNLFARKKSPIFGGLPLIPVVLVLVFFLAACGGNGMEETAPPATEAVHEMPAATEAPMSDEETGATEAPSTGNGSVSFANQVLPILSARCAQCHGGDRTEADLDVLSFAAVMAGGEDGPVVIPGDADASSFVTLVVSGEMPKRGTKLTPEQVQIFIDWVNQGALDN
jgi:hypothetical protein